MAVRGGGIVCDRGILRLIGRLLRRTFLLLTPVRVVWTLIICSHVANECQGMMYLSRVYDGIEQ